MRSEMYRKGERLQNLVDEIVDGITALPTWAEQDNALTDVNTALYPSYQKILGVIEAKVEWKDTTLSVCNLGHMPQVVTEQDK